MSAEFRSTIKLDAEKATAQAVAFSNAIKKGSVNVDKFNRLVKQTTQGGAENVFRKYENSVGKLDVKFRKSVASLHSMKNGMTDTGRELDKLTSKTVKLTKAEIKRGNVLLRNLETERKALPILVALNQKYDENARVVARAKQIRNELNLVVASGLKTKKEALAIFKREIESLKQSTALYKGKAAAVLKAKRAQEAEKKNLEGLRVKYDSVYAAKKKLSKVESELTLLQKKGLITGKQREGILKKEKIAIDRATHAQENYNTTMGYFARVARKVSIASRVMLVGYLAMSAIKAFVNIERTAESVDLLRQKLELFTGDSGAYKKFFDMTQEVGLKLNDAGKIITRFAVVTKKAFSIETMSDWVSSLTKSARATGTSTQEMTGALIQITQAMSAGRLMGDEYRSVTENLPLFTVALRKVFAGTNLSLKELSSQGLITNASLIEGFEVLKDIVSDIPGSVGTIDARIAQLSSSWDNFVNTVVTSRASGVFASIASEILNAMSGGGEKSLAELEKAEEDRVAKAIKIATDGAKAMKKAIDLVKNTGATRVRAYTRTGIETVTDANLKESEEKFRVLLLDVKQLGINGKTYSENQKMRKRQLAREADDIENLKQAQEKNAKDYASIVSGNQKIATLKELADLKVKGITKSTEVREGNLAPVSEKNAAEMILAIKRKLSDDIIKIKIKEIDNSSELTALSSSNDQNEVVRLEEYSGTVLKIERDLAEKIAEIRKSITIGSLESDAGLEIGSAGGVSEGEGLDAILQNRALAQDAVSESVLKTQIIIDNMTKGGGGGSVYEVYLNNVIKLNRSEQVEIGKLSAIYTRAATSNIKYTKSESSAQKDLANAYKNKRGEIDKELKSKYENEFSKRLKGIREREEAIKRLADAQKILALTSEEVSNAEAKIQEEFSKTVGMSDGASSGAKKGKTMVAGVEVDSPANIKKQAYESGMAEAYDLAVGRQMELAGAIQANQTAFDIGLINLEVYERKLVDIHIAQSNLFLDQGEGTWGDVFTAGLGRLLEDYTNVMTSMKDITGDFLQDFTDGFADSIGAAVVDGDNLRESLSKVANGALKQLVSGLIKFGIQKLVLEALLSDAESASNLKRVAEANSLAAAWAPAAAGASLATGGTNSAGATTGISLTYALTSALSAIGFEQGGFTGGGGRKDIAGVVHGQEFVMNADATSKNRGLLESLNSGKSPARAVETTSRQTPTQQAPVVVPAPAIRMINVVDPSLVEDYLGSDSGEEVILNIIKNNPELMQSLSNG